MLDCSDSARGGYGAALSSELEYGNSVCVWGGGGGVTKHKCSVACAASGGGERGRRPEGGERAHGRSLPATALLVQRIFAVNCVDLEFDLNGGHFRFLEISFGSISCSSKNTPNLKQGLRLT